LVTIFLQVSIALNPFTATLPYRCSGVYGCHLPMTKVRPTAVGKTKANKFSLRSCLVEV